MKLTLSNNSRKRFFGDFCSFLPSDVFTIDESLLLLEITKLKAFESALHFNAKILAPRSRKKVPITIVLNYTSHISVSFSAQTQTRLYIQRKIIYLCFDDNAI
jgi:hypothetical protein